jgi:dTDP-4-amino-4,6-dideoxygalactose transaminase
MGQTQSAVIKPTYNLQGIHGMDRIQAMIKNERNLKGWTQKRQAAARRYDRLLQNAPCQTPSVPKGASSAYHLYVIEVNDRDRVMAYLQSKGVMAQIHYPVPVHLQPCYKDLGYKEGDLPHTERTAKRILSLPLYPEITLKQQKYVAACLRRR